MKNSKGRLLKNIDFTYVSSFDIEENGIQVIENELIVEIYNDPFRSVPVFITRNSEQELILFSDFEYFHSISDVDKTLDRAGFWEIVLFGSALWTRTLYKHIEQMPSASKIVIDKTKNQYSIERYWDFDVKENSNITSLDQAAEGLHHRLDKIFSRLDRNKKYVMGMSGGMDSRITLAYLSKYIPKENLELFTFGFDEKLLEYKYACEVASALSYNKPDFHKLTKLSYEKALNYLPQMSGGQLGIYHCNILDYVRSNKSKGRKQISNYFSDALFGFESRFPKIQENIDENYYSKQLDRYEFLTLEVKEEIRADARYIFEKFNPEANYSSLNEFKYITERNQKFHSYLAYLQKSDLLFADFGLLTYMLSVPIELRENKKLLDIILDKYFNKISSKSVKNISSRDFNDVSKGFTLENKIYASTEWLKFRFLNRANAVLKIVSKGNIQLFNKYQTEDLDRLLYKEFSNHLKNATSIFLNAGIMSEEEKIYWDRLPVRSSGVGERFNLISLSKLI